MIIAVTTVHVIVCLFLIIVVLLQSGKAADLAGAFGGMGSQTAFGPRGAATVLSKATTIAAALFMITSLSLSILHTRLGGGAGGSSVLDSTKTLPAQTQGAPQKAPAVPVPAAPGKSVGAGEAVQLPLPSPPAVPSGKVGTETKSAPAPAAPAKK